VRTNKLLNLKNRHSQVLNLSNILARSLVQTPSRRALFGLAFCTIITSSFLIVSPAYSIPRLSLKNKSSVSALQEDHKLAWQTLENFFNCGQNYKELKKFRGCALSKVSKDLSDFNQRQISAWALTEQDLEKVSPCTSSQQHEGKVCLSLHRQSAVRLVYFTKTANGFVLADISRERSVE
jgi:hypothetical protein